MPTSTSGTSSSMNKKKAVSVAEGWTHVALRYRHLVSGSLFLAMVVGCLCAGLWPFVPPENGAQLVPGQNALQFVGHGTALSRSVLQFPNRTSPPCTIEVLLRPRTPWTRGTPLAFYNRERRTSFEIQQVYADLWMVLVSDKSRPDSQSRTVEIPDVFLKPEVLLTVTSDGQQTSMYANGKLLLSSATLALSSSDLSGLVILGNAPVRNHQWTGQVRGLAVYAEQLSAQTILSHSAAWTKGVAPMPEPPDRPVALYLFREQDGRSVRDAGSSGADLEMPTKYVTMDQIRFERPSSEARDANYKTDAAYNVYGFIPLASSARFFGDVS
jgi:concanavalin A-like lectin/glucanase superfamily protein